MSGWRGPETKGEFPTLGYLVADFIEENCVLPDGDRQGEPYVLTDEMLRFLLFFYRLKESGKFFYERGGQLIRPQKWGKGPFSAAIICAEAYGPVTFAGWDDSGEPVGRPWSTPHIQVTAVSEDQTDNIWRALQPMIELGSLKADIPDTGLTRINLPGGGLIEPVTSSARSRLGQRITFSVQDETHSWTKHNGGRRLADNQRRNLAGKKGRFLETTNAWDPLEESVAQETFESEAPGVFKDDVDTPTSLSFKNKRERRKILRTVYGDSAFAPKGARWVPWIDLDRIDVEIEELILRDPQQAERFFGNRKRATYGAAFDVDKWKSLAKPAEVPKDELIDIGVDGARFDDSLAIVGTHIETGYQWVIGVWEKPEHAKPEYEHPFEAVDGKMSIAFDKWEVKRVYVDPQYIEPLFDKWQGRWGDKVVMPWLMNRPKATGWAVRNYLAAIAAGDLTHDGDERWERHVRNARIQKLGVFDDQHRQLFTLSKDRPMSPRKIDLCMAGVLSWEARGDSIAAGETESGKSVYETRGLSLI